MRDRRRLLLVRHGLPDYRDGKAWDEPPGPTLSPIGRRQIEQTSAVVRAARPTIAHSSPLARALQSAEIISRACGIERVVDSDLKEWHRTDCLYNVTERAARWLRGWFESGERCAVVVGHASPLLAIIRTALYLPQRGWYTPGYSDRFEVSMGSVFELVFTADEVTATCLFHPEPRILDYHEGIIRRTYVRPNGPAENKFMRRRNMGRLIGYRR